MRWLLLGFASFVLPGCALAFELKVVERGADLSRPSRVSCTADGAVWVRAAGQVLCKVPGGAGFEPTAERFPGEDAAARRAAAQRAQAIPVRDRLVFGAGLRAAAFGARAWKDSTLCWYGRAATGFTRVTGDRYQDRAIDHLIHDLDVDRDGAFWAATDLGLVTGVVEGDGPVTAVLLPRFAPGNALDGVLVHEGAVHVFGLAGLLRREAVPGTSATTWVPLIAAPVRDARPVPGGLGVLTREKLLMFPGPNVVNNLPPGVTWYFAWPRPERLYVVSPSGLYSGQPGPRAAGLEVILESPPQAFACGAGVLAIALAGMPGGLWIAHESGTGAEVKLIGEWTKLPARSFLIEPGRLLVGTDNGLAAIQNERLSWVLRQRGLAVLAIAELSTRLVLATADGLLVLESGRLVQRVPLGDGSPGARITALAASGGDLWVTTAGQGLYRLRDAAAGEVR